MGKNVGDPLGFIGGAVCIAALVASICYAVYEAPIFIKQGQHKPTEQERAEQACAVIKSSPEYQVSSPGGDYRRNADEVCDAFRRNAVRYRQ